MEWSSTVPSSASTPLILDTLMWLVGRAKRRAGSPKNKNEMFLLSIGVTTV